MGQRPKLDPASFEQLLLAAWILQHRLEEEARRKAVATRLAVQLESPIVQSAPAPQKDLAGQVHEFHEAPRTVPNPMQPAAFDGSRQPASVAVRRIPDWKPYIAQNLRPGLSRIANDTKRIEQEFARAWKLAGQRLKPVISTVVARTRDRASSFAIQKVKIRIPLSPRRAFATMAVPVLVLVPLLFMLMQVSRQGRLSVAAATESVPTQKINPPTPTPHGPVSHLAITDSSVAALLGRLSRYEVRSLRRQALFGDDSAAMALGMLYETGRYVPQSCKEAAMWVKRAAEWGNAAAQYNLALRYRDGDGLTADENQAEKWLHKAAEQSYARAIETSGAQAE
jgi:hypothetical protein